MNHINNQYTYNQELIFDVNQAGKAISLSCLFQIAFSILGSALGSIFLIALPMAFYAIARELGFYSFSFYNLHNPVSIIQFLQLVITAVLGVFSVLLLKHFFHVNGKIFTPQKASIQDSLLCTALVLSVSALVSLVIMTPLNWLFHLQTPEVANLSGFALAWYLLTILIVAPIWEEIFFRKLLIDKLNRFGPVFAVTFSSICFGFRHLNFSQGIPCIFIGFVLGMFYIKTRNLKTCILAHALNNLVASLPMFSGWGMPVYYIVLLIAAVASVIYLIMRRGRLAMALRCFYKQFSAMKVCFKSGWIIFYFIFFLVYSILGTILTL